MEGLHDAQGAVGVERHRGEPGVETPATIGGTILAAAAESVAEGRGRGADDRRVAEASVGLLPRNASGAVGRAAVHGRRHVRRQREAEPAAPDRGVASAGAAAADVLAAVAGHFGETRRAAAQAREGGEVEDEDAEVVGRRDDERSIIGEYMPQ
jgi:hypothetical protein